MYYDLRNYTYNNLTLKHLPQYTALGSGIQPFKSYPDFQLNMVN